MTKIVIPQNAKEFDSLVNKVCKKFKFKNKEHAAAVIANRIQHMPVDECTTTLEYFGACIKRNIGYQVAQNRALEMQHEQAISQLEAVLKTEPNNQQALDELQKFADKGSDLAKAILTKVISADTPDNVLTMGSKDAQSG
jgi:hypothetical protein